MQADVRKDVDKDVTVHFLVYIFNFKPKFEERYINLISPKIPSANEIEMVRIPLQSTQFNKYLYHAETVIPSQIYNKSTYLKYRLILMTENNKHFYMSQPTIDSNIKASLTLNDLN
jgi:hypothetical protein